METPQEIQKPKRACNISVIFPCEDDTKAMELKKIIDEAVKDIENKRYTFQILET